MLALVDAGNYMFFTQPPMKPTPRSGLLEPCWEIKYLRRTNLSPSRADSSVSACVVGADLRGVEGGGRKALTGLTTLPDEPR